MIFESKELSKTSQLAFNNGEMTTNLDKSQNKYEISATGSNLRTQNTLGVSLDFHSRSTSNLTTNTTETENRTFSCLLFLKIEKIQIFGHQKK